jgi:hypothetical protein
VLVEFALIALVLYLILAATLEFGRALFGAQVLQQAADVLAREISRTPGLPVAGTLTDYNDPNNLNAALNNPSVKAGIFDEHYLMVRLSDVYENNQRAVDYFADKPIVNRLLLPLMFVDSDNGFLRYPGALVADPSGFHVEIPVVTYAAGADGLSGSETFVKNVRVVEEIVSSNAPPPSDSTYPNWSPFNLTAQNVLPVTQRGLVALRINYPFQAATLSATAPNPDPSRPNFRYIDSSDDPSFGAAPRDGEMGTYYGDRGLGNQRAFGKIVRPFRRLISAQAIYRREVF